MSSAFHSFFDETRAEHHTRLYRSGELVVRRGFAVRIRSDATSAILKPYSAHRDNRRNVSRPFEVSTQRSRHGWSLEEYDGDILLKIPADAAVGLYELTIGDYSDTLIVLFNPWCKDDEVYMQGTAEKREYVLNDAGRIWVGTADSYSSRSWYFGQFEVESLLASIDLVDRMSPKDRGSAIKVSRFLSAIINSQDDNGVITGNWSGNYSRGVSPLAWTGSTEILQKYWKRRRPVRYGQCWVYSGVFTSVLRALGIPARCITNFNSAHDSTRPYNRAVDKYFDVNGKLIEELSSDSIWNFHVWNEAYMTRPDLNEIASTTGLDFNGWQAVDATPQEISHGLYRMGPCPLAAIKNGVTVSYDTDFVIGEVNADILHFWQNEDGKFVLKSKHKRHVGKKISTKAIGSDSRDDTTHEYKYPEGSREEREALARRPSHYEEVDTTDKDVSFKAIVPADVRVGVPIQVAVEARSRSRRSRTVLMRTLCRVIDYTGSPIHTVDEKDGTFKIKPGSRATLDLRIDPEEYMDDLAKGAPVLQIYSTAKVKETGQTWSWENLVHLNVDRMLKIRAPESIERWESSEVQISITNMTSRNLTNVVLRFEGLNRLFAYRLNDIEVGAEVKLVVDVRAWEYGDQILIATLDTEEMRDISASTHVNVI